MQRTIGEQYEMVSRLEEPLWHTYANASQMKQVLTNLLVNARDAMPQGGRIVVETKNITLSFREIVQYGDLAVGDYLSLTVSDEGVGMSAEVRQHIFEPFFTTKELGKGTGLGLATCYGIVRQNGGEISVQSAPGQGTTIQIYLPRLVDATVPEPTPVQNEALDGDETVLLVDDDPMVRHIIAHILRHKGYHVVEAAKGQEALELDSTLLASLDILITDVVMPVMSGKELALRMKKAYPQIRILFLSGYTQDIILQQGVLKDDFALLAKPFTSAVLLKKVREVLQRK